MPQTIVFVSCVKTKAPEPRPARSLYTSSLFTFASKYAETLSPHWYVLSAKYGVVHPDEVIAPYEKILNKMPAAERKAWAADVLETLSDIVAPGDELVFLAGTRYREGLIPKLLSWGCKVFIPMEGLSFGRQLSWLKTQLNEPSNIQKERRINSRTGNYQQSPRKAKHTGVPMSQADQIRDHVIQKYIEHARKARRSTVTVKAKEVHTDLDLTSRYPAICSVLDGDKFKSLARVIIRSRNGPKQSSTVSWVYEILR